MPPLTFPETDAPPAWRGKLVPPDTVRAPAADRPEVSIGRPSFWTLPEALEASDAQPWTPPLGESDFWLMRLPFTLHPVGRWRSVVSAELGLRLEPRDGRATAAPVQAWALYPERLTIEDPIDLTVSLGPTLKFGELDATLGSLSTTFTFRRVFPIIQGFGAGEATPYWQFHAHDQHPLNGTQAVFAVLGAGQRARGVQGELQLTAAIDTGFGLIRLGLPREALTATRFTTP